MTTRRLADEVEYSQPVIYQHFGSMDGLRDAVAVDGFERLTATLGDARTAGQSPSAALESALRAYLAFAEENPATYEAMFVRATDLPFGQDGTPDPLVVAFDALKAPLERANHADPDTATEVLWSAVHGIVMLSRHARLRPDYADARIDALVEALIPA